MPFSSGTFSLVAGNPVVTGTTISSTVHNNTLSDIATNGLTLCLLKDGTQTPTANIPLGNYKITGLGAATAVADAPQTSQVQNSGFNELSSVSGTDTITGAATPTPAAYAQGQKFSFLALGANAAGPTLNVSSLGAVPIFWNGATATSSMWATATRLDVTYISTSSQTGFHVLGHSGFMPVNVLRTKGSIAAGNGDGGAIIVTAGADGTYLAATATASAGVAWKTFEASQAQQEAGTATDVAVTPAVQQYHQSAAKAWVKATTTGGDDGAYNLTSVTDTGTGDITVNWATDFSSTSYCAICTTNADANLITVVTNTGIASGATRILTRDTSGTNTDPNYFMVACYGDQA